MSILSDALSEALHSTGGLRVVAEEWVELCGIVTQTAIGFAATDSPNAWVYREEARDFTFLHPPKTPDELEVRRAEWAVLRQRWAERLRQSQGPKPGGR